jgi:DNA-directed RNA polymerase specialized sigma24 family protein
MGLLDWWRRRKREVERQERSVDEMRRVDEPDTPAPTEAYMSQTRD